MVRGSEAVQHTACVCIVITGATRSGGDRQPAFAAKGTVSAHGYGCTSIPDSTALAGCADGAHHQQTRHDSAQHRIGARLTVVRSFAHQPAARSPSSSNRVLPCSRHSPRLPTQQHATSTPRCVVWASGLHKLHTQHYTRTSLSFFACAAKSTSFSSPLVRHAAPLVHRTPPTRRHRFQPRGAAGAPRQRSQHNTPWRWTQAVTHTCVMTTLDPCV